MGARVAGRRVDLTAVRLGETVKPELRKRKRPAIVTPEPVAEAPVRADLSSRSTATRRSTTAEPTGLLPVSGQQVRFPEYGAPRKHGAPGDLYVTVHIT